MCAYQEASKVAEVHSDVAGNWIRCWRANDGFFDQSNWGRNVKTPSVLDHEEIIIKSRRWWLDHLKPQEDDPEPRIPDFHLFLCGDSLAEPRTFGLVHSVWDDYESPSLDIAEDTARKFTGHLGFWFGKKAKGSFSDKHEAEVNQKDRTERYIPQYLQCWSQSPCCVRVGGELISVDEVEDVDMRTNLQVVAPCFLVLSKVV